MADTWGDKKAPHDCPRYQHTIPNQLLSFSPDRFKRQPERQYRNDHRYRYFICILVGQPANQVRLSSVSGVPRAIEVTYSQGGVMV